MFNKEQDVSVSHSNKITSLHASVTLEHVTDMTVIYRCDVSIDKWNV